MTSNVTMPAYTWLDFEADNRTGRERLLIQIVRFVRGLRGDRLTPVTRRQIASRFRGTASEFVQDTIDSAHGQGLIHLCNNALRQTGRNNATLLYYYEITSEGQAFLKKIGAK